MTSKTKFALSVVGFGLFVFAVSGITHFIGFKKEDSHLNSFWEKTDPTVTLVIAAVSFTLACTLFFFAREPKR